MELGEDLFTHLLDHGVTHSVGFFAIQAACGHHPQGLSVEVLPHRPRGHCFALGLHQARPHLIEKRTGVDSLGWAVIGIPQFCQIDWRYQSHIERYMRSVKG